jgi:beta-galactosidase
VTVQTRSDLVCLQDGRLTIAGRPQVVLCASLFYFRIPRAQWRERIRAVRDSGYTCLDVYLPWNYHELAPGEWDFSDERDVAAFLDLAHEEGVWVIARPGPYICSEWDGGGLPAWLSLEVKNLRQNDRRYLDEVRRWYERALPILASRELGRGGSIIMVQLENELDFFDCADPEGYLAELRELALANGIQVPLIACAGQGDPAAAGSGIPGVLPTVNFYPDDDSPGIENLATAYRVALGAAGVPLCVTETNRAHRTLRRLLSCGAKFIAPYLQASGTNFGFTAAVNNWGAPLALMASDYDFGGFLSPTGEPRPEYGEARLLAGLIACLGEALAAAAPIEPAEADIVVTADFPLPDGGVQVLALDGGGTMVALPNLGDRAGTATITHAGAPLTRTVAPGRVPFVVFDLPLGHASPSGALRWATAEPLAFAWASHGGAIVFHADAAAEVAVSLDAPSATAQVRADNVTVIAADGTTLMRYTPGAIGTATLPAASGHVLHIVFLGTDDATRLAGVNADGELRWSQEPPARSQSAPALELALSTAPAVVPTLDGVPTAEPVALERAGVYRGFGWYRAVHSPSSAKALLLHGASDILSVYVNGAYQGTVTPGGGSALLPMTGADTQADSEVVVRAEIWGHSNFDDARLPALRLGALRGLTGVTAVTGDQDVTNNWRLTEIDGRTPVFAPLVGAGGWMTTRTPHVGRYERQIAIAPDADIWVLHWDALAAQVAVTVNGYEFGMVNPYDPSVDITTAIPAHATTAHVALTVTRWHGASTGRIRLLSGRRVTGWQVTGAGEAELSAAAALQRAHTTPTTLPVRLAAGDTQWLYLDLDPLAAAEPNADLVLRCTGSNAKITALFHGRVVGRVWLDTPGRPQVRGGDGDVLIVPRPWFSDLGNTLTLFVESVQWGLHAEIGTLVRAT